MARNNVPVTRGPQYRIVDVTPALAEKWLAQNTSNRKIRERAVMSYARDMESGSWAENGESIKFAAGDVLLLDGQPPLYGGALLDGQHRLQAVSLSGVTVSTLVVTGLENAAQETMDDGRKRTVADALTLRGETNAVQLAAIVRRALMWEHGQHRNTGVYTPTNAECLTFLAEHPELHDSAVAAVALRKPSALPGSVVGLTHWVFNRIDATDAAWFFDRLGTGAGLPQYHPILTLRKRAFDLSVEAGRLPEDMLLAFVIKAWNAFRDGDEMRLLRFTRGGANPEKFPTPK